MLLEAENQRYVSLREHQGRVILSVRVRNSWDKRPEHGTLVHEQGEEGVW
jgi:hypothetical protein